MTIHPASSSDPGPAPVQQRPDTTAAYDTTWAASGTPPAAPHGLERVMLADGKIYVVLAVVLIIWFGLVALLYRTDRKIERLERKVEDDSLTDS